MIPLFILSGIAVFVMTDAWVTLQKLMKVDQRWFRNVIDLVYKRDIEKAIVVAGESDSALGKMAAEGLRDYRLPTKNIEENMQVEARRVISKSEGSVSYLSMIATTAPMLGFLGTIFGVIKIFFNISMTNDFSISSISDGLYQKMICSAVGLLVGIVAYIGYYILNRRIDIMLLALDKGGSELMKAVTVSRGGTAQAAGDEKGR